MTIEECVSCPKTNSSKFVPFTIFNKQNCFKHLSNSITFLHLIVTIGGEQSVQVGHMCLVHVHLGAARVEAQLGAHGNVGRTVIVESLANTLISESVEAEFFVSKMVLCCIIELN